MIVQLLENISIANFPMIVGTFLFGASLMLLVVFIIRRNRTQLIKYGPHSSVNEQINLLQDERQNSDKKRQNGIISDDEHANVCLELDRRLLALTNEMAAGASHTKFNIQPSFILFSLFIPLLSTIIYLGLGSPQSEDQPIELRKTEIAAAKTAASNNKNEAEAALQKAINATKKSPKNVESWLMLAQAASALGDSEAEINALRTGIKITHGDTSIMAMLAEALSRAADGQVTVPARALIKTVLETDPNEPRALFLSGLAAYQDGKNMDAIKNWQKLVSISRPDAPWMSIVRDNIERAAEAGNISLDFAKVATKEIFGPDAETLANAAKLTRDEQNEMIAGMVQRLRDRLAEEPNDTDGWLRLARAYDVLGQSENTLNALANAAESAPNNIDIQLNLLERILGSGKTTVEIERAKAALTAAEKIAPNNPQILFFRGHLARLSGENEKARNAWLALLNMMEPNSDAAKALAIEIKKMN